MRKDGPFFMAINIGMLASYSKEFIYVKTMKTAGTSTEAWLERYCLPPDVTDIGEHSRIMSVTEYGIVGGRYHGVRVGDKFYNHMPLHEIRDRIAHERPWPFDRFKLIANTRNPWDKMVSMFWNFNKHRLEELRVANFKQIQHLFTKFIRNKNNHYLMTDEKDRFCLDDQFKIDYVIKYENLHDQLEELARHLQIEIDWKLFPKHKTEWRVRSETYQDYYVDQKCIDVVNKGSKFEIEQFGYTF